MEDKSYGWLTPYESTTIMQRETRRNNGASITGLVLGSAGLLAGIGAWIFGGVYAGGRAKANADLIKLNSEHTNQMLSILGNNLAAERAERVAQQPTVQSYIDVQTNPTQSGTAASTALSDAIAMAQAINNNGGVNDAIQNASYLRVQPISVRDCGCGCNGGN